jgi:O-antigen/teichoic acid export membrane protein
MRAALTLISGTALAHGLTAAALPILSRMYSPAEFGLLAVFSSLLAIISVVACLRYELAIALPPSDDEALHLLALSMASCLLMSLLMALIVLLAPQWLIALTGQPQLRPYLWLAPLGLLLAGSYSALQFWHVRGKKFTLLARTRVAQSAGSATAQITLGAMGISPLGLLLGYVMNTGIACLALGGALCKAVPNLSLGRVWRLALSYRRFPLFSSLEALANSAAMQIPVIMIAAIAAPAEAGYLMMAMYVAQAPMSLIGTAISQVYLSRAPEAYREGRLGAFSTDILAGLLKSGCGPLLAAGILSPALFGLVFGAGWERAGWLVSWMTPWFLLQFLAVPLSMALHVTGSQRAAMWLQGGGLLLRVGLVWAAAQWQTAWVAEAYAISGALFYLIYLALIVRVTQLPLRPLAIALRGALIPISVWPIGALGLVLLLRLGAVG